MFKVKRIKHLLIAVLGVLLALGIAGAVFLMRAPVLMVTDPSLTLLYGVSRAKAKQAELSFRLFRRFVPVMVSEQAGSDIIVAAIRAVSKAPRAVLFPYHYEAAAQRYKDEEPDIPALVFGGRQGGRSWQTDTPDKSPRYISTDQEADFFKAGIIAAFLAKDTEGLILVSYDNSLAADHRQAFERGLLTQGVLENPLYIENTYEFIDWDNISCALVLGGSPIFERNPGIPVILFSWADPSLTPQNVKAIFNDSAWSQAFAALRTGSAAPLASELIILGGRFSGKRALTRALARQNRQTNIIE